MKTGNVVLLAVLLAGSVSAQITRSFGSVVFPGGTRAISPQITRNFGSVVFPGGSPTTPPVRTGPPIPSPFVPHPGFASGFNGGNSFNGVGNSFTRGNPGNNFNRGGGNANKGRRDTPVVVGYPYPVYVPGYSDYSGGGGPYDGMPPQGPQQPNVSVVYPQSQDARPTMMQMGLDGSYPQTSRRPAPPVYEPQGPDVPSETDTPRYLIAFKDHSVYTSVAYWFEGDTLHYFTKGDVHNQAPVALIDRELTERLNRELGIDFKLPPVKR